MLAGGTFGRFATFQKVGIVTGGKGFEFGFLALSALWMVYLMATLFFYFADAFSADSRNNAMLFWKSMPQSDFKILASKLTAGLHPVPGANLSLGDAERANRLRRHAADGVHRARLPAL